MQSQRGARTSPREHYQQDASLATETARDPPER
jgi:hypothetical protein